MIKLTEEDWDYECGEDWDYECGDGCCPDYGTAVTITKDGVEVYHTRYYQGNIMELQEILCNFVSDNIVLEYVERDTD